MRKERLYRYFDEDHVLGSYLLDLALTELYNNSVNGAMAKIIDLLADCFDNQRYEYSSDAISLPFLYHIIKNFEFKKDCSDYLKVVDTHIKNCLDDIYDDYKDFDDDDCKDTWKEENKDLVELIRKDMNYEETDNMF